ncbi:MAG: glycosyltransferase family 4 protein [Flavobacteriaceae bacterium]|nr:glycosyltransferase family 4 protein [Flavobacteriaceae bacterium]
MKKNLHVVSFDVPYPANYGGVIDVFYKIKELASLGVEIYLHVFEYGKGKQEELEKYCKKVAYYKRNSFFESFVSSEPFIVKSRGNSKLIKNLKKIDAPILFDGLHTTYILTLNSFKNQKKYVRAHNIEHDFYKGLAKSESNLFKKKFFKREAKKLKHYERILNDLDGVFTISPYEQDYFEKKYGEKCIYIPAFHDANIYTKHKPKGKQILYHGNILVSENVKAALFLIEVYKKSDFHLTIASSYQNKEVFKQIEKYKNIHFSSLKSDNDLIQLFQEAHINVLPTFQKTGIKLKLLNTLYQGKFVIANDFMIQDTGLEPLCELANTREEFLSKTKELYDKDFTESMIQNRLNTLKGFSPKVGAQKIIDIIFS